MSTIGQLDLLQPTDPTPRTAMPLINDGSLLWRWVLAEHHQTYPSPELVFTNSTGGPVGRTSFRARTWKPAVRRAGLLERLRFHDLRHSYATWLVSDGPPPNIVPERG
jgi:integrase